MKIKTESEAYSEQVEYLPWSFFAKISRVNLPCGKMSAQVLLSQHLLAQGQEWKSQKNI